MSRFKRFAHSLASGYVLLGANIFYTIVSVPLALKYLSVPEFGLWTLAAKIGGFITLVDFGLSAAVARIIVDHKDDRTDGGYGGIIKTGFAVGIAQGTLLLLLGSILACFIGPLLHIHPHLQPTLKWVMIGQYALLAISFSMRTLNHVLVAHQRFDINNYTQSVLFFIALGVMWIGFAHGQGVFSILWAQAFTTVTLVGMNWMGCLRLKLLPRKEEWGKLSWKQFKSVFTFGNDIFIFTLGSLLISASQTILLTRLLGLEAATVWNIFTRVYDVLLQMIFRIFDYSSSALAEMFVRGEKVLLGIRFKQIVVLSTSLGIAAGTIFAVCNSAFVKIWTHNRFDSPLLVVSDIKEPQALVEQFQNQSNLTAQILWREFPQSARQQMVQLAANEDAAAELQRLLVTNLDFVIQGRVLTNETEVARSPLMSEKTPASASERAAVGAWFNRHLLEDAFPQQIANSRVARWSPWNDLLLAIWLVIGASLHSHIGLVGQIKTFRFMRYIFFIEGITFVGLTILLYHYGGITAMLSLSILCTLAFSFSYGLYRTRQYFDLTHGELLAWHRPSFRLAVRLIPLAAVVIFFTHRLPSVLQLGINAVVVGGAALFILLRYGLDETLHQELRRRVPAWARRMLG